MSDKFIVKQEKGKDSEVEVFEITINSFPRNKQALVFTTDQSLFSQSDRAYNVQKAIDEYASPKGYRRDSSFDEKNKQVHVYSQDHHSLMTEFAIREQVKADPRFISAASDAVQEMHYINNEYGSLINKLKSIVNKLENENRDKLKQIAQELIQTQVLIVKEVDIPDYVLEHHRKFLLEPHHPYHIIERAQFTNYPEPTVDELCQAVGKFF
jgi:hypothetical protein